MRLPSLPPQVLEPYYPYTATGNGHSCKQRKINITPPGRYISLKTGAIRVTPARDTEALKKVRTALTTQPQEKGGRLLEHPLWTFAVVWLVAVVRSRRRASTALELPTLRPQHWRWGGGEPLAATRATGWQHCSTSSMRIACKEPDHCPDVR